MLSQSYAIEQFRSNFSKITTIKEAIALFQDPKIDLSVAIRATQIDTNWDAKSDSLTGSSKIILIPKLHINGELYKSSFSHSFEVVRLGGLETEFLKALKDSLKNVGGK